MAGGRSKRSAATAAESKISKFVEEEKNLDRKSRSKKPTKYDLEEFDKDYFDDSSSDNSSESEDSDSNHNCQPSSQKRRTRGKKRKNSTELNKSPLWYR